MVELRECPFTDVENNFLEKKIKHARNITVSNFRWRYSGQTLLHLYGTWFDDLELRLTTDLNIQHCDDRTHRPAAAAAAAAWRQSLRVLSHHPSIAPADHVTRRDVIGDKMASEGKAASGGTCKEAEVRAVDCAAASSSLAEQRQCYRHPVGKHVDSTDYTRSSGTNGE